MGLFSHHDENIERQDMIMKEVPMEVREKLSIAGKLRPLMALCHVSSEELHQIWANLCHAIDAVDITVLFLFCFFSMPLGRLVYTLFEKDVKKKAVKILSKGKDEKEGQELELSYENSLTYTLATLVQQIARLAALVYFVDCMLVVMDVLGFEFPPASDPSGEFCRILYFSWTTFKLIKLKRYLLGLAVNRKSHQLGKVVLCDRILDIVIYSSLALGVMDTIRFELGPGLTSLFAFGGMGTFVFGLASKDIASHIVSGITLTTSEKFHVGEDVRLGDGTRGVVEAMGWLHTDLRMFDEISIKIPNTQLTDQRISNFSRIDKCRVLTTLRVSFDDFEKIPKFCTEVKEALKEKCEHLISDGSRPFRANWRECECDHLKVVVDTHHNLKPIGDVFAENQELVYQTIFRVAKQNNIKFAVPTYNVTSTAGGGVRAPPLDTH